MSPSDKPTTIKLPAPQTKGNTSVEETIARRRSVRSFRNQPLSLSQLSQMLWVAQGVTDDEIGFRAVPSAGAAYPLELFVSIGKSGVDGIEAGLYHYEVSTHSLRQLKNGDPRPALAAAALGQRCISQAPVTLIIGAVYDRTARRYGQRAARYIAMEAGHAGQNVHLEAVALGLATVMVGAFDDDEVAAVLEFDKTLEPLYMMPVGWPAR